MKSFESLRNELNERAVRTGAVATLGMKSKREGNAAGQAFKLGRQRLRDGGSGVSVEQRLVRIEGAVDALLDGLIKQRAQIGSGVAVDVVGHTLAAKSSRQR